MDTDFKRVEILLVVQSSLLASLLKKRLQSVGLLIDRYLRIVNFLWDTFALLDSNRLVLLDLCDLAIDRQPLDRLDIYISPHLGQTFEGLAGLTGLTIFTTDDLNFSDDFFRLSLEALPQSTVSALLVLHFLSQSLIARLTSQSDASRCLWPLTLRLDALWSRCLRIRRVKRLRLEVSVRSK